mgnify:CR=1 FL=1
MLVYRPHEELLKWRGYSITVRSEKPTEDMTKFDKDVVELRMLITSAIQDKK